ncbi:MAG: hypothetical protein RIF32_03010 [Leptospirales bacterium]|jgi:3-oxo-5-alpha-steroid 4-dehydrogenase 1
MQPIPNAYFLIPDTTEWLWFIVQLAIAGFVFWGEGTDRFHLAYSKFRKGAGGISTRAGMLIIYGLPLLVVLLGYNAVQRPDSPYHIVLFLALAVHFGKRCLEVIFVHRYSRPMGIGTALLIGGLYSYIAFAAHFKQNVEISMLEGDSLPLAPLILGGLIFLAGQAGNLYHHLLLRDLRGEGETGYVIPRGGLFGMVTAPHYLFEIIAWIGYAVMARHLGLWGIVLIIAGYLAGRAKQTREWYLKSVPGYPEDRKALVPGVW